MEEKMKQVPLEFICRHDRTAEVCRAAVEEDGWQLENVPEEMKTPELCRKRDSGTTSTGGWFSISLLWRCAWRC